MITLEVNERTVEAQPGEMLLPVLRRAGVDVPTLCNIDGLFPTGACRMCVVEVEGQRGLVPSCAFPVADGMKVRTHTPRVVQARKTIVELLLADHPDDCLYCVRNAHCELQGLAENLGIRQRHYGGQTSVAKLDTSSPSIVRDPAKCILCGRCVRVCEEIQGVGAIDFIGRGSETTIGTAFDEGLNISSCINCGQCVTVCPTGALREKSSVKEVFDAIHDPELTVVVQHAPSISVTLAEELGLKAGSDVCAKMTSAMRRLGFDFVFDTSFSADLTIMEEASEFVQRLTTGGTLPMMTSCSPGWIKFIEQYYPELLGNLSTCKSPQQMLGAIIKSYFAQTQKLDPKKIFSVAVMPCTAKKFEARRPEMRQDGVADVDAVLTTREFARMIEMRGIDIDSMPAGHADTPFGERSSAGKLFGGSGGVMEAAARTAYNLVTGKELPVKEIRSLRGMEGIKTATLDIEGTEVNVAVVSGLGNARKLMDQIKAGECDLHFVEIMTCPGGCINGGGQPLGMDMPAVMERMKALYRIDRESTLRTSHGNEEIQRLYKEFLGEPLGETSHHLLHTHYAPRDVLK